MKTKITLLSLVLLSGSLSFGQTNKNLPTERLAKNGISNPGKSSTTNFTKADAVWENDFSTPSDWVATNSSEPTHGWEITNNVTIWSPNNSIATPTAANGFAFCNSDAAGDGSTTNATLTLASDQAIDLTGINNVTLEFYNYTGNYATTYTVSVSGNNGGTWTNYIVNSHIGTNDFSTNPELVRVNISASAGNQSQVLIRFNYQASWGFLWAIDDVAIVETPENDISILESFATLGEQVFQYSKIPVSQVVEGSKFGFGTKVKNLGSLSQTLTLNVTSAAGSPVQSSPLVIATTLTDSLEIPAVNGISVPSTVGVYDFTLQISNSTNNLVNTEDDSAVHPFEITNNVMAVDTYDGTNVSVTGSFTGFASNAQDPGIGIEFEAFKDFKINRVQVGIFPISSANQEQYIGNEVFCQIWKYNEEAGWALATNVSGSAAISQTRAIQASDFGTLINLDFEELIEFSAGDIILPIAGYYTGSPVPIMYAGKSVRYQTTGIANGALTGLIPTGNYNDVPVIRLFIDASANIEESAIESMNVTLYPNPASNNATIAYTLNTESTVTIEVRDLSGKLVYSSNEGNQNTGANTASIATDKFAEGMYTYTLTANGSQVTNKFIVKK
jgi:hypothetical protein